jgi:hypothetical protein
MLAATACFVRRISPALSPVTPSEPHSRTFSTTCTTGTAATLDSCSMESPGQVLLVKITVPEFQAIALFYLTNFSFYNLIMLWMPRIPCWP